MQNRKEGRKESNGEGRKALLLGRFQPFHLGHEKAVRQLLKRHGALTIAIGSSNKKRTEDDPFSSRERAGMIRASMGRQDGRVQIALVPDQQEHSVWIALMLRRFPPEKYVIYSNNPLVRRLFAGRGYEAVRHRLYNRRIYEGVKIRRAVCRGRGAEKFVPGAIRKWMRSKGNRIIRKSS